MIYQTRDEMLAALGGSVRAARLAANLLLETLAARSGMSMTALRNLEGGKRLDGETFGGLPILPSRGLDSGDCAAGNQRRAL